MHGLGRVSFERGETNRAREFFQQALSIRREAGEKDLEAETRLALAELNPSENDLEALASLFEHDQRQEERAEAEILLLQCALGHQERKQAAAAALLLKRILPQLQGQPIRLAARTALAQYDAYLGGSALAATELQNICREAAGSGFFVQELETELALAQDLPHGPEKLRSLQEIKRKAEGRGLRRIAAEAAPR